MHSICVARVKTFVKFLETLKTCCLLKISKKTFRLQTCITSVLTGVDVSVLFHVGFLVETLAAERAGEWSDVSVDQQVGGQRRRSLELFLADSTPELA